MRAEPPLYALGRRAYELPRDASARDRLKATGYPLLRYRFSDGGIVLRALGASAAAALRSGVFSDPADERDMARLERRLQVHFVTHELSDALSVAKPWSKGAIGVFDAGVFNKQLASGDAGVLGFAEAGHVFRYPFVARALSLDHCLALVACEHVYEALTQQVRERRLPQTRLRLDALPGNSLNAESDLRNALAKLGLKPAELVPAP